MARTTTPRQNGSRSRARRVVFRSYRTALAFLNEHANYERLRRVAYNAHLFNLSRMGRLLQRLGNPHRELRYVHIAGTKGKGSTAAMIAAMLQNCGYRVGLYTSPHILDVRERIAVDGEMISEAAFARAMSRVATAAAGLKNDRPTYFEILTAAAFVHFVAEDVDIVVLETGLGGRLDATNVVRPDVCAITSISYDHMQLLGNSLAQIAEEKAGIFKPGVPVISAPQEAEVATVLRRVAGHVGCPLRFTGDDIEFSSRFESSHVSGPQTRICVTTPNARFEHLHVPLMGEHQAINCGVALGVIAALKERGWEIDDLRAVEGLANVRLPGRMEMISENPRVLVDVAHNPASMEALMRAIGQNVPYDSMIVIFACMADKDIRGMLRHIQIGADKVIFTTARSVRSADPDDLATMYMEQSGKMAQVAPNLREALNIAARVVTKEDLICVCGSFHIVGQAKQLLAQLAARRAEAAAGV